MKKDQLIILSDLWGKQKSDWIHTYRDILAPYFEISYYDCCVLGKINTLPYTEKDLHQQFINGGIATAVTALLALEKEPIDVLSFSIGGTIAWKAALAGLEFKNLYAVSATRLRYETQKPKGNISLFYGEKDEFAPDKTWCNTMQLEPKIIANTSHNCYTDSSTIASICKAITANKLHKK